MKKLLMILVILVLVLGAGSWYIVQNVYHSKSKDLGVNITEQNKADLKNKIDQLVLDWNNSDAPINATLNDAEASIFVDQLINQVVPASDVQVKLEDDKMQMSAQVTLPDELKDQLSMPIPLPDDAAIYLQCAVPSGDDTSLQVESATIAGIPVPKDMLGKVQEVLDKGLASQDQANFQIQNGQISIQVKR